MSGILAINNKVFKTNSSINTFSRGVLGFLFIYHGLVPKILLLSPVKSSLLRLHS